MPGRSITFQRGLSLRSTPLIAACMLAGQASATEMHGLEATSFGSADIVLLGEVHDNPAHHETQARIVEQIAPPALVFEMLTPEDARTVNSMGVTAPVADFAAALDWESSGWPDFSLYSPILTAAPEAIIYGAALPIADVRRAMAEGAAAIFGERAETFGLDRSLAPEEQRLREEGQQEAHCNAMPPEMLPGLVEAQRLRDAHFSRVTLDALRAQGGPVIVITGNGHARKDWGMPAAIRMAAPEVSVFAFGQFEAPPQSDPAFDLWHVTAPVDREDPCAAFQ